MKDTKKQFDKTEDDLKALQSMGQIIGEVLRQLDEERCASTPPHREKNILPPPLTPHRLRTLNPEPKNPNPP